MKNPDAPDFKSEELVEDFDRSVAYLRHRIVREEIVDDRLFIIDSQEGAIHMLEKIGIMVWAMLDQKTTVDQVVDTVAGIFPSVDLETIDEDVEDLFAELEGYQLIAAAE